MIHKEVIQNLSLKILLKNCQKITRPWKYCQNTACQKLPKYSQNCQLFFSSKWCRESHFYALLSSKPQLLTYSLSNAICRKIWEFVPTSFIDETSPPPPPPPQLIYAVGLSTHLWTLDSSKAKQQLGLAKDLTLWLGQNPNFFCRSSLTVPLFKDNFFGTKLLPDRTVVTVIQKHTGCPLD